MRLILACLLLLVYRLTAAPQPNVIVLLADDAGWGDYSFNGNRQVATPNIDAIAKGGRVAAGGKRHALGGNFYEPTVLLDVTPGMRVAREETFGPVAPLIRFTDEAEVLRLANDTAAGLAAYFFTRDLARSWRVQEALEYGLIGVNTGLISTEVAPFGGVKESGLGREGSRHSIDDYTELKYVCVGGLSQ